MSLIRFFILTGHISLSIHVLILYVVMCGSKNGYQKDICMKEIGLRAKKMITVLSSIVNQHNGGTYMTI